MKIKNPTKAFAIKFKKDSTIFENILWVETLLELIAEYPKFTVEGLTSKKRKGAYGKKEALALVSTPEFLAEIGTYTEAKRNVITVGVSSKYDVSFESLDDLTLNKACGLYALPVFDMEKDISTVLARVIEYASSLYRRREIKFKETECKPITYHSNFIRVGHSRVDYNDEPAVNDLLKKRSKKKAKKKAKKVKYILKGILVE